MTQRPRGGAAAPGSEQGCTSARAASSLASSARSAPGSTAASRLPARAAPRGVGRAWAKRAAQHATHARDRSTQAGVFTGRLP